MGYQRRLAGRPDRADEGKVIAVTLRGEMFDRRAHQIAQEAVLAELPEQIGRRPDLAAARTSARTEMRHRMYGIEQGRRGNAREHGHRHRAANIGRMHPRMDRGRSDHAADRDRSRRTRRAGVGHDGARLNHRRAHQFGHAVADSGDIGLLFGRLRLDVGEEGQFAGRAQRHDRGRLEGPGGLQGFRFAPSGLQNTVGRGKRRAEPATLRQAGIDQVLSGPCPYVEMRKCSRRREFGETVS